jgi:hypothetical protein
MNPGSSSREPMARDAVAAGHAWLLNIACPGS